MCVLIGKMLGSTDRLKRPDFEVKHFSLDLCDSGTSAYIAFLFLFMNFNKFFRVDKTHSQ